MKKQTISKIKETVRRDFRSAIFKAACTVGNRFGISYGEAMVLLVKEAKDMCKGMGD